MIYKLVLTELAEEHMKNKVIRYTNYKNVNLRDFI